MTDAQIDFKIAELEKVQDKLSNSAGYMLSLLMFLKDARKDREEWKDLAQKSSDELAEVQARLGESMAANKELFDDLQKLAMESLQKDNEIKLLKEALRKTQYYLDNYEVYNER